MLVASMVLMVSETSLLPVVKVPGFHRQRWLFERRGKGDSALNIKSTILTDLDTLVYTARWCWCFMFSIMYRTRQAREQVYAVHWFFTNVKEMSFAAVFTGWWNFAIFCFIAIHWQFLQRWTTVWGWRIVII